MKGAAAAATTWLLALGMAMAQSHSVFQGMLMIYSPAFDALAADARAAGLARIREQLTDRDTLAILDDTKPGWR